MVIVFCSVCYYSGLGGTDAPEPWQGGLNIKYRLGPGFREANWTVNLEVNNHNTMTTTQNVIGVLRGREEPGSVLEFFFFLS